MVGNGELSLSILTILDFHTYVLKLRSECQVSRLPGARAHTTTLRGERTPGEEDYSLPCEGTVRSIS